MRIALNQRTLKQAVLFVGKGLHSGRLARMLVEPAPAGSGIQFLRTDLYKSAAIPAIAKYGSTQGLSTRLEKLDQSIESVENVMAAFCGLGIWNAFVRLDGSEVPVLDGTAGAFVTEFQRAGIIEFTDPNPYWKLKSPLHVVEDGRSLTLLPAESLRISCTISYPNSLIGTQKTEFRQNEDSFFEFAQARTFCLLKDVYAMREQGMALGGGLDNALVVDGFQLLNQGGLFYPDEFARHKIIDIFGDLALLGAPLAANIVAYRSNHSLQLKAVKKLIEESDLYLEESEPWLQRSLHTQAHDQVLSWPYDRNMAANTLTSSERR